MKLLLDTHVWIWSVMETRRIKPSLRRILDKPQTEAWLSPVSVWEALYLAERNRIRLPGDPRAWVRNAIQVTDLREAPLTIPVALASRELALPHADPADRFIAATAAVYGLKLVTADQHLLKAGVCDVLAA